MHKVIQPCQSESALLGMTRSESQKTTTLYPQKNTTSLPAVYICDVSANFCTQNTHTQSSMLSVHFMFFFQQINLIIRGKNMVL